VPTNPVAQKEGCQTRPAALARVAIDDLHSFSKTALQLSWYCPKTFRLAQPLRARRYLSRLWKTSLLMESWLSLVCLQRGPQSHRPSRSVEWGAAASST
jgi:hypothetical protein